MIDAASFCLRSSDKTGKVVADSGLGEEDSGRAFAPIGSGDNGGGEVEEEEGSSFLLVLPSLPETAVTVTVVGDLPSVLSD